MRVSVIVAGLLLATAGCAWLHEQARASTPASAGWAAVEVDQIAFDGEDLHFRLLVSAHDGGIVLDRRLIPSIGVDLHEVSACDGGPMPFPHYIFDFIPDPLRSSDLLSIRAGEWFGARNDYPIFIAGKDGGDVPSCVDATFLLHLESAANTPVSFRVMGARSAPEADAGLPGGDSAPEPEPGREQHRVGDL